MIEYLGLKHPIIFDVYNLCHNYHSNKLSSFNVSVERHVRVFRNTLQIYRSKKRPFSQGFSVKECDWMQQKIISFCNFPAQEFECMVCCPIGNVTSCALCIGYHLNIINIIVETNYEAYYKMKLQNEWGTFIDLKVLAVSYPFLWCPPQYLGDPIRRNGGIHAISCKIRNIRNTLKHGIYRIFCIWFELDWRKSRGNIKNSIFVLP